MKRLIFGDTGIGKSYTYVTPIINNGNILLITPNGINSELKYLGDLCVSIKNISIKEILNSHGNYGIVFKWDTDTLIELITNIEHSALNKNTDFTVIFTNFMCMINNLKNFEICYLITRLNNWKCNLLIEHTCSSELQGIHELELKNPCWDNWELIPVIQRLY